MAYTSNQTEMVASMNQNKHHISPAEYYKYSLHTYKPLIPLQKTATMTAEDDKG